MCFNNTIFNYFNVKSINKYISKRKERRIQYLNSNKKVKLVLGEKINLILSILVLIISLIKFDSDLLYGGFCLILASIVSIFFIRIFPYKFKNYEINIIQTHIFLCIFLGTILNFYSLMESFDFLLHLSSGFIIPIISIPIISYFTNKSNINISDLPISFLIFIMFCFASTCGIFWEMYEFSGDQLFKTIMQGNSLMDTMTDIIANTIGTTLFCIMYFFKNKRQVK